ncbi:px domain-containing [Lecanosticta acicola]|uniref:Px domain-containing n=1 Tax=Lecanosticta acicola TaxID=111012 RepID=A0AAI8Z655_9PEZI|nr:px domain-containing [Lecanosticta acicola]
MDSANREPAATVEANNSPPVPVRDEEAIGEQPEKYEKHAPADTGASPQSTASVFQTFTDRALHFLSHASNETLGACLAGLGATTYLVLGRVGLVIIGAAGGVVLHATWEGIRGDTRDDATKQAEQERRRETGVEVAKRVLDWRKSAKANEQQEDIRVHASQALDYSSFGPETAAALNTFTDAVIKDYVHYWYDPAIPNEPSFPTSCRRTFTAFVLSLSNHLGHKRPADTFMDFLTNASSILIVFLQDLAKALNASPNRSAEEAVSAYLKMKPDSSLSYMLDQDGQKLKLSDIAEDMLQSYLDPKSYNCPPVHIFLKEVLAQLVLGYTVTMCSDPTWINEWIVYGLEESETTKEVMDIVDAGVEGRSAADLQKPADQIIQGQSPVKSKKEGAVNGTSSTAAHRRKMSKAEEAMDEAMREARRLTEMMMEDDRRRTQDDDKRQSTSINGAEDSSDGATQGAPTPSSSQSGRERQEEESTTSTESSKPTDERRSSQFTSFAQLVPNAAPTALAAENKTPPRPILTLHNANISIFDDSGPGEKVSIKAKPTTDYLVQIEPASQAFPGWMISRKYADFENLHEVLKRLSAITGVSFNDAHAELPKWRVHTKASLRTELERYLTNAVRYQPLAESEGMKRFLEKDQGLQKSPSGAVKGFGWPTPDAFGKFGGDMMNVLTKAPKQVAGGVAGGGKAVFGGVAGLVGGGKKPNTSQTNLSRSTTNGSLAAGTTTPSFDPRPSLSSEHSYMTDPMTGSFMGSVPSARESQESLRAPPQPLQEQRRGSAATTGSMEVKSRPSVSPSRPASIMSQNDSASLAGSSAQLPPRTASLDETINLPPPPSEMPADYDSPSSPSRKSVDTFHSGSLDPRLSNVTSSDSVPPATSSRPRRPDAPVQRPISEQETSHAIELIFAVISELYTLSGAWQIRRTLLTAAKTFLLRPGNPQVNTIRDLLQKSLLDENLSDSGLAHHIYKLRYNALPTPEEMEAWKRDYPEKTPEQKEELRIKARKLLVTKGMPQALTSVMGAAASGEALGKVFDGLQVPEVSRGLVFGLMLQALRVVTQ